MNVIQNDIQMQFFGGKNVESVPQRVVELTRAWKADIPDSNLPGS